jgi:ABC-type multidrug transport system fused ATPase/permease subunit
VLNYSTRVSPPLIANLRLIWQHISPRRRTQFWLLLILMLLTSIAEMFSIGMVLPFLGVLTAPEHIFKMALAQPFIHALGITASPQLLLPLTILFCAAACVACAARLLLLWASMRLSFAAGADLSLNMYYRTLHQPYLTHCLRNSSEVIVSISAKANGVIYSVIAPVLTLVSSSFLAIIVLTGIFALEPFIALAVFVGFALTYTSIIRLTKERLLRNSQQIARESTETVKLLQEGLGGIRDVLLDGNQRAYCDIYSNAIHQLRRAQGNNLFITGSPRYVMEALGMILITVLAYSLAQQDGGIAKAMPTLGALALGAQRLLPVLQQAYGAWSTILGEQASLRDTLELLNQPLPDYASDSSVNALPFSKNISLSEVSYRYSPSAPYVLDQINLTIAKGARVGFIGSTGSGKSTLLDLVMGLLDPTEGVLTIDGQRITSANRTAWQVHIAHVPQAIFLADSSVEENIAFGIPKDQIDHSRVREAARQAQIAHSIEGWPKQYKTFVGERGIRLSGGQRQRVGIARALYKKADVIIFDEATSALDGETEGIVMDAIENLNKNVTSLIIAHRVTTLKNCTLIVELSGGRIKRIGTYQDIVSQGA